MLKTNIRDGASGVNSSLKGHMELVTALYSPEPEVQSEEQILLHVLVCGWAPVDREAVPGLRIHVHAVPQTRTVGDRYMTPLRDLQDERNPPPVLVPGGRSRTRRANTSEGTRTATWPSRCPS